MAEHRHPDAVRAATRVFLVLDACALVIFLTNLFAKEGVLLGAGWIVLALAFVAAGATYWTHRFRSR